MIRWKKATAQDLGRRGDQQDRVFAFEDPETGEAFMFVADGVGGQAGGASAAQCVLDVAHTVWQGRRSLVSNLPDLLRTFCRRSHEAIVRLEGDPRATLAAVFVDRNRACWAHSGDSRVYHFHKGRFQSRSADHSVVQILVDKGKVTEGEMAMHPDQGRLLQSLGGTEFHEPEIGECAVSSRDAFLVCTDGFWAFVERQEIGDVLGAGPALEAHLRDAVRRAVSRAGNRADNVSAAALVGSHRSHYGRMLSRMLVRPRALQLLILLGALLVLLVVLLALPSPRPDNRPIPKPTRRPVTATPPPATFSPPTLVPAPATAAPPATAQVAPAPPTPTPTLGPPPAEALSEQERQVREVLGISPTPGIRLPPPTLVAPTPTPAPAARPTAVVIYIARFSDGPRQRTLEINLDSRLYLHEERTGNGPIRQSDGTITVTAFSRTSLYSLQLKDPKGRVSFTLGVGQGGPFEADLETESGTPRKRKIRFEPN